MKTEEQKELQDKINIFHSKRSPYKDLLEEIESHFINAHEPYKVGLTKKFWNGLKNKYES